MVILIDYYVTLEDLPYSICIYPITFTLSCQLHWNFQIQAMYFLKYNILILIVVFRLHTM